MSINNPNFDKITGNPVCLPVPWKDNDEHLQAWKEGLTGYPWIDALQKQVRSHYRRHSVRNELLSWDRQNPRLLVRATLRAYTYWILINMWMISFARLINMWKISFACVWKDFGEIITNNLAIQHPCVLVLTSRSKKFPYNLLWALSK